MRPYTRSREPALAVRPLHGPRARIPARFRSESAGHVKVEHGTVRQAPLFVLKLQRTTVPTPTLDHAHHRASSSATVMPRCAAVESRWEEEEERAAVNQGVDRKGMVGQREKVVEDEVDA